MLNILRDGQDRIGFIKFVHSNGNSSFDNNRGRFQSLSEEKRQSKHLKSSVTNIYEGRYACREDKIAYLTNRLSILINRSVSKRNLTLTQSALT